MSTSAPPRPGLGLRSSGRRPALEALLTFVLGIVLVAIGLVRTSGLGPEEAPGRWVFVLPLAVICAVLLLKRRRPVLALALGAPIFVVDAAIGGSLGVLVAFVDLLYCVARWGPRSAARRVELLTWAATVLSGAAAFVAGGDLRESVLLSIVVFTALVVPIWWGREVRSQAELAALAAARNDDLVRLSAMREQATLRQERTRMASDLHDALAGDLAAIGVHAEAALARPGDGGDPADRAALQTIREASVTASEELRTMVRLLRSDDEEHALPARLEQLGEVVGHARRQGVEVAAELPRSWPTLPAAVDHAAYRIVQESLTNAARHAPEAPVRVRVSVDADAVQVEVSNPQSTRSAAAPARHDPRGGTGLLGMRERAEALGGALTAGPTLVPTAASGAPAGPGTHEWRVHARLPLTPTELTPTEAPA